MDLAASIGILGGTFSPIHHGHLRLALEARDQLGLDEVRLIPAGRPPHRPAPTVDGARRLRWVERAIDGIPGLVADGRELGRDEPSYTVTTLESLRAAHRDVPLVLLLGLDAAQGLPTWHRWQDLPSLAHLAVFSRPGDDPDLPAEVVDRLGVESESADDLLQAPAGRWRRCSMPALELSASLIRSRLSRGHNLRGWVPRAVLDDWTDEDRRSLSQDAR